jgi:hypothetical protein
MTMIEMQSDSQVGVPYGCLVTMIIQLFVLNNSSWEPESKPVGPFGKHTVMKSNA